MNTITQSDVFSFRRLYWFARKEILENWKLYSYSSGAIITWYLLFYGIKFYSLLEQPLQEIQYNKIGGSAALAIALFWVSVSVANQSLGYMSTKSKAIANLTIPVSVIERLVWAVLTVIFSIAIAAISWKIIDFLATPIFYNQYPELGKLVANITKSNSNRYDLTNSWIILLALFMLGSIWFGRFSFFKTVGLLFGTWLGGYMLHGLWLKSFLKVGDFTTVNSIWIGSFVNDQTISKYENVYQYWLYCLPVLLLVTIYFKIKDKEV